MSWVIDLHEFPWSCMDTGMSRELISILSNFYPERLKHLILVRPMLLFHGFWKVISVFVDRRTKEKVTFLRGDDSNRRAKLAELLGDNWCKQFIDKPISYNAQEYWTWVRSVLQRD